MTGLDFLIEPVAVSSDFWSWENGAIPLFNYVCWFLIALPLHFYLIKRKTPEQNPVSIGLFLVLIVFFGVLNFCE
jgi:putative membrane protein